MSLLLAVTLAAATQAGCSWDNQDHHPHAGGSSLVAQYNELTTEQRLALKQQVADCLKEGDGQARHTAVPHHLDGVDLTNSGPVQVVPEPDTWAMLLAGISLVGWQVRRRRKNDQAR